MSCSIVMILVLAIGISACPFSNSADAAATYSFSVEYERLDVFVLKDGSIDIDYSFGMTNFGYLDGVDIGLPNKYYDLDSAEATIIVNDQEYAPALIHKSPYVEIGVAVEFTSTVMALIDTYGTSFQLDFHINNPHMVYENELVEGTVGIAMRPTWFGDAYQVGPTEELTARVFFPDGFVNVTDAVYLEGQPWNEIGIDPGTGLLVATWTASNAYPAGIASGEFDFGAGFPAEFVDSYVRHTVWNSIADFFASLLELVCLCIPIIALGGFIFLIYMIDRASKAAKRKDYFNPAMGVVGSGPRRDLTAVEAAIVLERPLEMVATMILFGLVKKGMVRIDSDQRPMKLTKLGAEGEHTYETDYLRGIGPDGQLDRTQLEVTLVDLIKRTETKLDGFDYRHTKNYYQEICSAAWKQVKDAGTPEEFASVLSDKHEWMMLDNHYETQCDTISSPCHTSTCP